VAPLTPEVLGQIRFDVIIGRGALSRPSSPEQLFPTLLGMIAPGGTVVLAEPHARRAQRLYRLLDLTGRPGAQERLAARLAAAEEAIYSSGEERFGPEPEEVRAAALAAGFSAAQLSVKKVSTPQRLSTRAV